MDQLRETAVALRRVEVDPHCMRAESALQIFEPAVSLDDVLQTPLLTRRRAPARDIVAEHRALTDLISSAAIAPIRLLPRLVELGVELCHAGSAGVSLLEPGSGPQRHPRPKG